MNLQLNLTLLSKYRTQLMGIAMLWVIWKHSQLHTGLAIFDLLKRCDGGVDIFLLLSGMGLYLSLNKDSNIKRFYKRRFLRIIPYYLPIVLLFSLFLVSHMDMNPDIILYNMTTLSFWLNYSGIPFMHGFDWFIPGLLFLYLITPIYYKLFIKNPVLYTVIFSILGIIISLLISGTEYLYLLPLTTRFPIYFGGLLCGYAITKQVQIKKTWSIFLSISMILGFCLLAIVFKYYPAYSLAYGLEWYPFILIAFPLSIILSLILNSFPNFKFNFLLFTGKYSLVIYLLHERLLAVLNNVFTTFRASITLNLIAIVLTLVLGYYYQNNIDRLIKQQK